MASNAPPSGRTAVVELPRGAEQRVRSVLGLYDYTSETPPFTPPGGESRETAPEDYARGVLPRTSTNAIVVADNAPNVPVPAVLETGPESEPQARNLPEQQKDTGFESHPVSFSQPEGARTPMLKTGAFPQTPLWSFPEPPPITVAEPQTGVRPEPHGGITSVPEPGAVPRRETGPATTAVGAVQNTLSKGVGAATEAVQNAVRPANNDIIPTPQQGAFPEPQPGVVPKPQPGPIPGTEAGPIAKAAGAVQNTVTNSATAAAGAVQNAVGTVARTVTGSFAGPQTAEAPKPRTESLFQGVTRSATSAREAAPNAYGTIAEKTAGTSESLPRAVTNPISTATAAAQNTYGYVAEKSAGASEALPRSVTNPISTATATAQNTYDNVSEKTASVSEALPRTLTNPVANAAGAVQSAVGTVVRTMTGAFSRSPSTAEPRTEPSVEARRGSQRRQSSEPHPEPLSEPRTSISAERRRKISSDIPAGLPSERRTSSGPERRKKSASELQPARFPEHSPEASTQPRTSVYPRLDSVVAESGTQVTDPIAGKASEKEAGEKETEGAPTPVMPRASWKAQGEREFSHQRAGSNASAAISEVSNTGSEVPRLDSRGPDPFYNISEPARKPSGAGPIPSRADTGHQREPESANNEQEPLLNPIPESVDEHATLNDWDNTAQLDHELPPTPPLTTPKIPSSPGESKTTYFDPPSASQSRVRKRDKARSMIPEAVLTMIVGHELASDVRETLKRRAGKL